MKLSDIMSAADLTIYPKIALVLFLFAFFLVVLRIFWPGARAQFAQAAVLPLDDVNDRFAGARSSNDHLATGRASSPARTAATPTEG